jgi:type I restriction-modification system DNA methylase subunit
VEGGELMQFDRVLTNPPFSINWGNYRQERRRTARLGAEVPERFRYGQVPLGGKKADLMFLQHMVAVTARRRHGRHRDAARRAVSQRGRARHPRRRSLMTTCWRR